MLKFGITVLIGLFGIFSISARTEPERIRISDDIELIKLSDKIFVHVSESEITGFGKVSSNGMILIDGDKACLFDTPGTDEQTQRLVEAVEDLLNVKITMFIPNHWHEDCMGGIDYLHEIGVRSYANRETIIIAGEKGLTKPLYGFTDSLILYLNDIEIQCYYPGPGHTRDNIVVWIPSEQILFGGCVMKDIHSRGRGNIADADTEEWPKTIMRISDKYSDAKYVIPGHGEIGGPELFEHTYELVKNP
jgi:metallo-beta-lactamase class B